MQAIHTLESVSMRRQRHRTLLQDIARRAMVEWGLLPDFGPLALAELSRLGVPGRLDGPSVRDLRALPWCSIDNDDSRDLDQLTVAEELLNGMVKLLVAVADVDALVSQGSALDEHAQHNTTSVYTAGGNFPMLPDELSTDLCSLNLNEDRRALVVEMTVGGDGSLQGSDIYMALVRNHARLAYDSVAAWLEQGGSTPDAIARVGGLEANLRLQDRTAQLMKDLRHVHGALTLETVEARPVFVDDVLSGLEVQSRNRATEIIEDLMIAANGVTARYLSLKHLPSVRRVVRSPRRWDRIVEIAAGLGSRLPIEPDPRALEAFLVARKAADPQTFPDLSLAVIKLLGSGEYVAEGPGDSAPGHFGLAVHDYSHSTAPNRRYTDLITQRLLKAALRGEAVPYTAEELQALASHCTSQENVAEKVERQVAKSAAALVLEHRVGEQFDSIVTGASAKGTWVRLLSVPVEGKVVRGFEGLDVGDRARVQLSSVDVERGYIDLAVASPAQ